MAQNRSEFGIAVRHSYDSANGKGAIYMVSAWANANRLVLGQQKVNEKSNEITAIPLLLQVLAIEGCIVTIDAMGTQKDIAATIIDRGQTTFSRSKATKAACLKMCNGCLSKLKQPTSRMGCMTLLKP